MKALFHIRESHLKRAPFGVVLPEGLPLAVNGKLARFATESAAAREANRLALIYGGFHYAARLDSMAGVAIHGMHHVLHSSGAN